MSLKVLCAGCSAEERERAESDVRRVLGSRVQAEPWIVSLVKVANRWSVTLNGPGAKALTCVAPDGGLSESIREALAGPAPKVAANAPATAGPGGSAGAAPQPPKSAGPQRVRQECGKCSKAFVVMYDAMADEDEENVPVACPHCWHVNHVLVAASAAEGRDYKAEKA